MVYILELLIAASKDGVGFEPFDDLSTVVGFQDQYNKTTLPSVQ